MINPTHMARLQNEPLVKSKCFHSPKHAGVEARSALEPRIEIHPHSFLFYTDGSLVCVALSDKKAIIFEHAREFARVQNIREALFHGDFERIAVCELRRMQINRVIGIAL